MEDKEMKIAVDESMAWEETDAERLAKELPESPASVNLRAYINGFAVQFTMRSLDIAPLIQEIDRLIKTGVAEGWKPSWKDEGKPVVPAQQLSRPGEYHTEITSDEGSVICPVHGEKMYPKQGKFGNYYSHGWQENGYWMNCSGRGKKQGRLVTS